ncbi:hypothetical protein L1887_05239 [Cichorium endivia]|nr:hypothetical protein L1887_05239 [Cichorium endivia]
MIRVWWKKRKKGFRTGGSVPNALVIATCDVVKLKVAAAEHISQFNEETRSPSHAELVLTGHVDNAELVGTFNIIWKSTFTTLISNINFGLRE